MDLNLNIDHKIDVKINGAKYPVSVVGSGIPCLIIGTGTLMLRTLSDKFRKNFKIYSTDLYWDKNFALDNFDSLTMAQIADDIYELSRQLNLDKLVLMGHSAFGIVAVEFAKKYGSVLLGAIVIGSPTNSNQNIAQINDKYFQKHADDFRKQVDAERRSKIKSEDLSSLSYHNKFMREYAWRDAPRYWHDPEFDCAELFDSLEVYEIFDKFFGEILPNHVTEKNIDQVKCPVFVAAGLSDYDCCPYQLWTSVKNLPTNFEICKFEKSGHYPNFEEQDLFDQKIIEWANNSLS